MTKDGGKAVVAVKGSSSLRASENSHANSDGGMSIEILFIQPMILILKQDRFIFSTATMPEPEAGAGRRAFLGKLLSKEPSFQGRRDKGQVEPVPMLGLVGRGWSHKDMGWDHREQRWYHPVWPKLNHALSPDESKAKWKLDWEHEGVAAIEIPNTQESVAGPSNTNMRADGLTN